MPWKMASMEDFQGETHCWSKNPTTACIGLIFVKNILRILKTFVKIIYGLMRQKVKLSGRFDSVTSGIKLIQNVIKRTAYQQPNSVMVWGWFAVSGWFGETMNFPLYQKILKETVWPSPWALKLKQTQVMQDENVLKNSSKSMFECLKKLNNKWRFRSGFVKSSQLLLKLAVT